MGDSIKNWWTKIKAYSDWDRWWLVAVIILIGLICFGLGRLTKIGEGRTPVRLECPSASSTPISLSAAPSPTTKEGSGGIVASTKGTKYHLSTCPGAKAIKPENLIHFASVKDAAAAGDAPAAHRPV
jgi:hypothetical protein